MKKLIQIFQEDSGKFSSKRVWGGLILFLCGTAFVVDGLHFYTVNEHIFDSFLTAGTVLIGVNIVGRFAKPTAKK